MKSFIAVILAAGEGTRMKSETSKVLHEICGKPMIEFVIDNLRSLKAPEIVLIAGKNYPQLKKYLANDISLARQNPPKGTAHAISVARNFLKKENILVAYGDTPLLQKRTISGLINKHSSSKASATLLTMKLEKPQGYGRVLRDKKQNVCSVREQKDLSGFEKSIKEVNAGLSCFRTKDLLKVLGLIKPNNKKREYYLTDAIKLLYEQGNKISSFSIKDKYEAEGINTQEELSALEKIMRKNIIKKLMNNGVRFIDPDNTYVAADARIGTDTIVYPGSYIEKNCVIGKKCKIGPNAHIRPGTKISDKAIVGNFAEVNRSFVGEGSQINHFSYIGDAQLGKRVNIGAGTVTANYDGKKKNKTIIGDNAFIGSGTILVAPVTIGRNAITGAGSVVTKNSKVKANSVVVGIPAKLLLKKRGKR